MAKNDPPMQEGRVLARQAHLGVMLNRSIDEIERVIADIEKGDFSEASDLPRFKRDMVSAAKQLREAEIELDAQRHREKGRVPGADAPIDFNAARAAIGRRLDRLRRTESAEEAPEGDEG
ncbi:MAG: hypothetical protein MK180_14560 [Rhodobacteraceae bacterium]|nr:hypothetical protein [Paracoccaceae bacterium]